MAGVSHQTVSKVLNRKGYVGTDTRDKVLRICQEVGYVPNEHARQLAGGRNLCVGVAFFHPQPSFTQPFYVRMFQGIIDELSRLERDIVLAHMRVPEEPETDPAGLEASLARFRSFLRSGHIGAALVVGDMYDGHFTLLRESRLPVVYVGSFGVPEFLDQVAVDVTGCCQHLVAALVARHYRRAFFCFPPREGARHALARELWQQFGQQAAAAGILTEAGLPEPAQVCRQAAESGKAVRTAVVCTNDEIAEAVITAACGQGLAVPGAFGVTGLGNHAIALSVSPAITTVDFNYEEMGRLSVSRLLELPSEGKARHQIIQGTLKVRGSI
jgi:LacI family sucrose operon transcriptional repressor